jgi:N-acetylglucosamine-6-sulfatase
MKHRSSGRVIFIFGLLFVLLPLFILAILHEQDLRQNAQQAPDKPNIIVIMTDDQRWDAMETLPTVTGKLANNGVTFTNAYLTTPLCCPSRAAFLTGLFAHNNGVWKNDAPRGGYSTFKKKEKETIAVWLKQAGYKTGIFGKLMNNYMSGTHKSPGWDKWYVAIGGQQYFGQEMSENGKIKQTSQNVYFNDLITNESVKFIKDTKQPFFLLFSTNIPHGSQEQEDGPGGLDSPELPQRFRGKCDGITPWKEPPSFNEKDVSDKPKWVKELKGPSAKSVANYHKGQRCALKVVNESIDKMIAALGEERMQNTVFIFYSDNGYSYGEHRHIKKNCFYEECARTPLIISYPKLLKEKKTSDALVSHIDITATIAELAGTTVPVKIDGKSLVPILKGSAGKTREAVLIEIDSGAKTGGYAIRTAQYKYTELNSGEKELYDLTKDPYELENIEKKAEMQAVKTDLAAKLKLLKEDKDIPLTSPTISTTPSPSQTTGTPTRTGTPSSSPTGSSSPSPSSSPTTGTLSLTIGLHGIGSSGDNRSKTADLSNKDPETKERDITVELYNEKNEKVTSLDGSVTYDESKGVFTGTLPYSVSPGLYTIKVTIDTYLRKLLPGFITVKQQTPITLPSVTLVAGDTNSDNILNIQDYNALLDCYEQNDCNGTTDINDDSETDGKDMNLWLREILQQRGD